MHRLTQTIDVVVYKLTVEGTVEERILELQEKKRLLAKHAIEGGMRKKGAGNLGIDDLMALFRHDVGGADDGHSRGKFGDAQLVAQDVGAMLGSGGAGGRKPAKQAEHATWGRRWD